MIRAMPVPADHELPLGAVIHGTSKIASQLCWGTGASAA